MSDSPLQLLQSQRFRKELAQIGARATLATLDTEVSTRWTYRDDLVIRNLTAIGQELWRIEDDATATELRPAILSTARAWEHLATLQERTDPSTALLTSALFYELAGYQANATCLARMAFPSRQWTTSPSFNGLVSAFVQRLFVRVRTLKPTLTEVPPADQVPTAEDLQRRAAEAVAAIGVTDAATFFLTGVDAHLTAALEHLSLAKEGFAQTGHAVAYNALMGIEQILPLMVERSTWRQLQHASDMPRWQRYLRVLGRGLGSDVLESRSVSELWPSQRAAVDAGLLSDVGSLAIRMPTSAGKTRVAELAIVHSLVTHPGSKCVYIAPYRALASEIEEAFTNLVHDLGFAASSVPGGYEQDEMGESIVAIDDILVLTPEKLDLLFRLRGDILDQVALIVIDEGHLVSDRQRGPKFELLVSRLKRRIPQARFLMMSAVVADATLRDFAVWLAGDERRSVSSDWRPSLLKYGRLDWDGTSGTLRFADHDVAEGGLEFIPNLIQQREFSHIAPETRRRRRPKFPRSGSKGDVAAEVAYRFAPLGPVLVFCMQTNWAESTAFGLLRRIELARLTDEPVDRVFALRDETRSIAVATEWLGDDHEVVQLLRHGVAFHHGRLPSAVRAAIEDDFRSRQLGVLVATSTLAQGVNLPVRTVVMHGSRGRDRDGTRRQLDARDYWNIAGRAGRAGAETEGTVIHLASSPYDRDDFERYAVRRDDVERVESALHRMLRDLVDERISSEEAATQLDADLLALLVEEDEDALDEDTLAETLTSSLFSIQARETERAVDPLIRVMTSTAQRISTEIADVETRRLFASTGLSSKSCQTIAEHAADNRAIVHELLEEADLDDRDEALDLILDGLAEVREMEPEAGLRVDSRELLSLWTDGELVRDIAETLDVDPQDLTEFIEDAFSYRLPWGISAYTRIAATTVETPVLSPLAANVAGMVKYGVPSPPAAWAMTVGVASRTAALALADEFLRDRDDRTITSFRRWFGRLNPNAIAEELGLSGAELESTARAILRSQPNEYLAALDVGEPLLPLEATCRPLRRAVDSGLVYELEVDDQLSVHRDWDSQLNRNAIFLSSNDQRLGYLEADAARALGLELDAGLSVTARILEIQLTTGRPHGFLVEIFEI